MHPTSKISKLEVDQLKLQHFWALLSLSVLYMMTYAWTVTLQANACLVFYSIFSTVQAHWLLEVCHRVTLTTPTWGTVCHHKSNTSWAKLSTQFDDSSISHSRDIFQRVWNCRMCHVALSCLLGGQFVIWRLVLFMANPCTKFEVCSFSCSKDISWGVKF